MASIGSSKAKGDKSLYDHFTLPNALEVVLVHTPDISVQPLLAGPGEPVIIDECDNDGACCIASGDKMAAACLTVNVGTFADPPHLPGLAHFLEHMLFMGSANYPEENAFEAFLSRYGGYSNATTDCESTTFFFEVHPTGLAKALDMFAQLFIAPLFLRETMDRELLALDAEFESASQHDRVRLQQILCDAGRRHGSSHPYHQFGWGNTESLRDRPREQFVDVRAAIADLFHAHYSANGMKLAVCSPIPLVTMATWVRASFSEIINKNLPLKVYPPLPPGPGRSTVLSLEPMGDNHLLHLFFPLPPASNGRERKQQLLAAEYVRYVLRHEGSKSLLTYLYGRGWVHSIEAGITETQGYEHGTYGSVFEVEIGLSLRGVAHWDAIVGHVFSVLRFLERTHPLPLWIADEFRATAQVAFDFASPSDPLQQVQAIATYMQPRLDVDRTELLQLHLGTCMHQPFAPESVARLLMTMTPSTMLVALTTTLATTDIPKLVHRRATHVTEEWGAIAYTSSPVCPAVVSRWTSAAPNTTRLPSPNPFVPTDFTLEVSVTDRVPVRLAFSGSHWLQQKVESPLVDAYFQLELPFGQRTLENYVNLLVYVRLVTLHLRETMYFARCAEMDVVLSCKDGCVHVVVSGLRHHLPQLILAVFKVLAQPADLVNGLDNNQVDHVATGLRHELTAEAASVGDTATLTRLQLLEASVVYHSVDAMARALGATTLESFVSFATSPELFAKGRLTSYFAGNVCADTATAVLTCINLLLHAPAPFSPRSAAAAIWHTTTLPITGGKGLLLRVPSAHTDDTNTCVETYFQLGPRTVLDHAYANVLRQIMREPLYHDLRTVHQIGYHVGCYVRVTHHVLGFSVVVESSAYNASDVALRIDDFLHNTFRSVLRGLTDDDVADHVRIRQASWQHATPPADFWGEITAGRLEFNVNEQYILALGTVTRCELLRRYDSWFVHPSTTRKLRVHVVGQGHAVPNVPLEQVLEGDATPVVIQDISAHKANLARCCEGGVHTDG
ncbi:nardilysin [Achlya hypogyna]|uniref:Nardilysin n=1 Tax=Achlya hypogyna TaxID=1202772 RepID=A0A1V9YVB2_ACHHY|nr:nardilysin [Achlya hypogyna]